MSPQRSLKLFCTILAAIGLGIALTSALGVGTWPGIGGLLFGSLVAGVGIAALIITNSKGTK